MKLKHFLIGELLLTIVIIIIGLNGTITETGLIIDGFFAYVPVILLSVIFVLHMLELVTKNRHKLSFIRTFLLVLTFVLVLAIMDDPIDFINVIILGMMFIYAIVVTITLIFVGKHQEKKPEVKLSTMPAGWFEPKYYYSFLTATILLTILSIVFILFSNYRNWLTRSIYSIIIIFLTLFMISYIQVFRLVKKLIKYEKTLNFDELMNHINKLRKNKLAEDSRAYLDLIEVDYLFNIDLNKAIEIFNNIKKPEHLQYKLTYDLISLCVAINAKDYSLYDHYYEITTNDFAKIKGGVWLKNLKRIKLIKELMAEERCNPEIEQIFKLDQRTMFSSLNCAMVLVQYYKLKGEEENMTKYIKFIKDNGSGLKQLMADINSINIQE